jgi:putative glycosyltransferase (TIGR04372 family)
MPDGTFSQFSESSLPRESQSRNQIDGEQFWIASLSDVFVTNDTGSSLIAGLYRKPMIQTNLSIFGLMTTQPGAIAVVKKYIAANGEPLTLRTLMALGVHKITEQKTLDLLGITIVENSLEDLKLLANEIVEVAHGKWLPSASNLRILSENIQEQQLKSLLPKNVHFANSWLKRNLWFFQ